MLLDRAVETDEGLIERTRQGELAAPGARWPGHRDHLVLVRSADRPAGRQAWSGRGSPRLRLVGARMSEHRSEERARSGANTPMSARAKSEEIA